MQTAFVGTPRLLILSERPTSRYQNPLFARPEGPASGEKTTPARPRVAAAASNEMEAMKVPEIDGKTGSEAKMRASYNPGA